MKKFKLDRINLAIFNSLIENNKVNFSKLGKKLGLSHVAVNRKFDRLVKKKIIKLELLINFSKLDFKLGLILLEVNNEALEHLLKVYQECPRVVDYFELIGQYNLGLIFFGENDKTFETILKSCMLYSLKGIHKSNILIYKIPHDDLFLPFNFSSLNHESETTPCGISCSNCGAFKQDKCVGCPSSKHYTGVLKIV